MNTVARTSSGSSARRLTIRPTAWRKNRSVRLTVAYTATTSRGTSTPSLTMFTATSHLGLSASPRANLSILACAPASSLTTTTGFSPAIVLQQCADSARVSAVVAEHEPGRVGNDGAGLAQERVSVTEHLRQQRRRRIDRGPQPPGVVLRLELVGERGDHLLLVDTPAERRVEQPERERPADSVGDSIAIAVDVIGRAAAVLVVARRTGSRARRSETACPTARADGARSSNAARSAVPHIARSPA